VIKSIAILALALALGGCATMPSPIPAIPTAPVVSSDQILTKAKEIQAQVARACAFVPTLASITSIISKSAGSYLGIANEICMAITSVPLADGGKRKVVVRGVPVAGKRI
jgi:hypothetical protein